MASPNARRRALGMTYAKEIVDEYEQTIASLQKRLSKYEDGDSAADEKAQELEEKLESTLIEKTTLNDNMKALQADLLKTKKELKETLKELKLVKKELRVEKTKSKKKSKA